MDIHYYPVVDCDPKGTEKIALCMCKDEKPYPTTTPCGLKRWCLITSD